MKLLKKRRLLNSYESILFAYLLMFFSLISSRFEYLECFNCGLDYKIIVTLLYFIVFFSYQILTLNAFLIKKEKIIFYYYLYPSYLPPLSIYYFLYF